MNVKQRCELGILDFSLIITWGARMKRFSYYLLLMAGFVFLMTSPLWAEEESEKTDAQRINDVLFALSENKLDKIFSNINEGFDLVFVAPVSGVRSFGIFMGEAMDVLDENYCRRIAIVIVFSDIQVLHQETKACFREDGEHKKGWKIFLDQSH